MISSGKAGKAGGSLPKFQVVVAFDHYRVGDIIEPTGLMRDRLLRLKFIVPLVRPCRILDPLADQEVKVRDTRRARK